MSYQELLHRVLDHNKWVRHGCDENEAVDAMVQWMYLNGGDSTCILISYYGDNLRDAVRQALGDKNANHNADG